MRELDYGQYFAGREKRSIVPPLVSLSFSLPFSVFSSLDTRQRYLGFLRVTSSCNCDVTTCPSTSSYTERWCIAYRGNIIQRFQYSNFFLALLQTLTEPSFDRYIFARSEQISVISACIFLLTYLVSILIIFKRNCILRYPVHTSFLFLTRSNNIYRIYPSTSDITHSEYLHSDLAAISSHRD